MAGVTPEMIQDYIRRKGGRVKNVDLVKHFRKHLLFDDPVMKDQAREIFKEKVNSVAVIRQEEKEKFLYLKEDLNAMPQLLSQSSSQSLSPPQSPLRVQHPPTPRAVGGPSSLREISHGRTSGDNGAIPGHLQNGDRALNEPGHTNGSPQHKPSPTRTNVGVNSSIATPTNQNVTSSGPYDYYSRYSRPVSTATPTATPTVSTNPTPSAAPYKPIGSHGNEQDSPSHNRLRDSTPTDYPSLNRRSGKPTDLSSLGGSRRSNHTSSSLDNNLAAEDSSSSLTGPSDMLQIFTEGLTNFSRTGVFSDSSLLTDMGSFLTSSTATSTNDAAKVSSSSTTAASTTATVTPAPPTTSSSLAPAPPPRVSSRSASPRVMNRPPPSSSAANIPSVSSIPSHTRQKEAVPRQQGGSPSSPLHQQKTAPPTKHSVGKSPSPPRSLGGIASSREADTITSPVVTITRTPSQRGKPEDDESKGGVRQLIQQYTPGNEDRSTPSPTPSPTRQSSGSPLHKASPSPTHPSLLSPTHSEGGKVARSVSSVSSGSGQLNYRDSYQIQRSGSNVGTLIRRSRALDVRNSNLDNITRQSIKGVPAKSHRLSKTSDELSISREELLANEQDRESPEEYILEVDPMEKEWMHALIDGNIDMIHRLIMADKLFINRKGFLNGWTALHWAAKLGNIELMSALVFSGAHVDIRSNGGMTPLHLAAESGNELVMRSLVLEHNASVNLRDHSGRRPLDMLHPAAPESARSVLRNGLISPQGPRNVSVAFAIGGSRGPLGSFNVPRGHTKMKGSRPHSTGSTLNRTWSSMGQISDKDVDKKSRQHHHIVSPRAPRKGFSFRKKNKYQINHSRGSSVEEKYSKYD